MNKSYKKYDLNKIKHNKYFLRLFQTINVFIYNYNLKYFNLTIFIIISVIIYIVFYLIIYNFFKKIIPSFLFAFLISLIPYNIVKNLNKKIKNEIKRTFPTYVLSLKNYTDIDNNIITAISSCDSNKYIKKYIDKFKVSVFSGMNVYTAFENLKNDIDIKEISQFIFLLQNCHINGGNYSNIIEKYVYLYFYD